MGRPEEFFGQPRLRGVEGSLGRMRGWRGVAVGKLSGNNPGAGFDAAWGFQRGFPGGDQEAVLPL